MILNRSNFSKAAVAILASSMLLSFGACSKSEPEPEVKNPISEIKLTESQRSWVNTDEKYSELTSLYGDMVLTGTMAVATDDDTIYLYAENETERDGKTIASQDTTFDMASVSKTFTAVCVLQLMEQGKISFDDTLDKYFPEYETGKKIKVYNLVHMNSGIPDYCNNPDLFWNISGADAANAKLSDIYLDKVTDEDFLAALYQAPLSFEPGSQYEYSNSNYHILAMIIEKASGMKYCDYVKENIFDKCGMTKTTSMGKGDMTYKAEGFDELLQYGFCDENGYPACPNNCRGDGGIHSCVTDMIAFDRALFGGKLLKKESMEILLKDEGGYCCGLMKESDGYSHDGSSMTCRTNNKIIESEKFGHIYVVTLERDVPVQANDSDDPMAGTKFAAGSVADGIYTNEYAELKVKAPEGFEVVDAEYCKQMMAESVLRATDANEKKRLQATCLDGFFWKDGDSLQIYFMNTKLAAPDDSDYTEEDFIEDELKGYEGEFEITRKEISKVTLGGQEYTRAILVVKLEEDKESTLYIHVRKLDDNLMLEIDGAVMGNKGDDYFEQFFLDK